MEKSCNVDLTLRRLLISISFRGVEINQQAGADYFPPFFNHLHNVFRRTFYN